MNAKDTKVGDIIICINNGELNNSAVANSTNLTLGKSYTIINCDYMTHVNDSETNTVRIVNDLGNAFGYYAVRFENLKELRKQKLEKLKSL